MDAFEPPPGIGVKLFAKIKAPGQNTGDLQISGTEIKIRNNNKWTTFEQIYNQQSREKDIFDSDIQRIIPSIMNGYSISVFMFGSYSSDKRELLSGIIELVFNHLWKELSTKTNNKFKIQLNSLECIEDTLYDLMDINNNNLVIEHTIDGPSVLNLQTSTLTSIEDFSLLFNEIMNNRTQQLTEFGPKAAKSSFFLTLKINHNNIHSQLHFIEFPAADKLIESAAELRMREGPTLNKELIGLSNLINSFHNKSTETPYYHCKTNMLLQEVFGGNCISFGIICLDVSNSMEVNKVILEYANKFNMIDNYPVINDNRIRGLLMKYYKRYHSVCRELETLKKQVVSNINDVNSNNSESKLLEFRSILIEKEKELISLHGDKDKLSESYGEFRKKYSELINKKCELQKELILSEQKCLNISRTLIDIQIENNDLKKNESIIRAELETKLIATENDILETTMREQNLSQEIINLKKEMSDLLQDKKTLSIEYVALRCNYMNLNSEFDDIKQEQQDLNVQLINLINNNKALGHTSSNLKQENEILLNKNKQLHENKTKTETTYKDYESERLKLKSLNDKQAIELIKYEVEISRLKTEMESTKTEFNKKWLKISKEKEIELQNIINQRTNESQNNRVQTQQLQNEVETLKGQIRVANREITNNEQKCIEYEQNISILNKDCQKLRDSLKYKTDEFRTKLLSYLKRTDTTNNNNNESTIQIEDLKVTQKKLYEALVSSHNEREEELILESENERKKNRKLYLQLQNVTHKILLLQDFIKDVAPNATLPIEHTLYNSNDTNNDINKSEEYDEKLKYKINELERELEKEKRAHVNTAEMAQQQQELIQKELLSLKKIMKEQHSDCDPMSHQMKIEYKENINKLKTLQQTLEQQMEHNQKMLNNTLQVTSQQNVNNSHMLKSQINELENKIKIINQEKNKLKKELLSVKNNNNNNNNNNNEQSDTGKYQKQIHSLKKKYKENDNKYKKKIQELKNKILQFGEQNGNSNNKNNGDSSATSAWNNVKKLEEEKAQLIAKLKALQAEYNTMETHYKKELQKYKKIVAKLKKTMN